MISFLSLEKKYALCETETSAILADVKSAKKGQKKVVVHSTVQKDSEKLPEIASLFADTGKHKAKVALVLPLKQFELVSVSVPPVATEAIAKLLPYSLSKILDTPVTDYIYDWQIAQKFKDRYELTVFLYPKKTFSKYQSDLLSKRKEITWFEPDVYAGCAYLQNNEACSDDSAYLFVLAWKNSVSMATSDNKRVNFVRNFDAVMPKPSDSEQDSPEIDLTKPEEVTLELDTAEQTTIAESSPEQPAPSPGGEEKEEALTLETEEKKDAFDFLLNDDSHSTDILSGFGVHESSGSTEPTSPPAPVEEIAVEVETDNTDSIKVYVENLNLEILRTLDYHNSVLKGKPIKAIFIGGAEDHFDTIAKALAKTHNIDIHSFPPEEIDTTCSQTLAALCLGALQR